MGQHTKPQVVEIEPSGAVWVKSSVSGKESCVEVSATDDTVEVRDSQQRSGPHLLFSPQAWRTFLTHA